jgi:general secretion pathway protein L
VSEILTVRLSRQNIETIPWLVWSATQNEIIASGELDGLDSLGELTPYAEERSVILLLDGQDVLLREIDVPSGGSRQLTTMLPFLMEDDLAQDIDELHFSILKRSGSHAWIGVVERDYLAQRLQQFTDVGIEVHKVLPEVLAIPVNDSDMTLLPWGSLLLARYGEFQGFTVSEELFPYVCGHLPLSKRVEDDDEETRALNIDCYQAAPNCLDDTQKYNVTILPAELPMELLAKTAQISTVNLLTGEFKRQSSWLKNMTLWRAPAIAATILLVLFSVKTYTEVKHVEQQAQAYRAESERIFRTVFPDKNRIPTVSYLKRQLSDETVRLNGGSVEAPLFAWLTDVQSSLKGTSNLKIQSVRFDGERKELRIQAQANDFQTFEKLRVALSEKFEVEQGQLNRNDQLVSSSYVLKVK